MLRSTVALAILCLAGLARASPEVALDDPATIELARLRASGALPPYLGGLRPLTEARIQALRDGVPVAAPRLWLAPIHHLRMRAAVVRDRLRPYSTEIHPRDLAGGVAISCEHREGRACGDGGGLEWELDSAAGFGSWISAATRVRAVAGSGDFDPELELDRAHVNAELGPIAMLAGRSVIVLGPSARTQVLWGDHAAPLDHVRVSTARPFPLIGGGSILRGSALFFIGHLRESGSFDGSLIDGSRLQADLLDTVEIGLTHLIQLGGDGAPDFSFGEYVLEHFQHNAGGDSSLGFANHRISGDLALSFPRLAGLRVYYEGAAEDLRDEFFSMLRRDADHVLGVEIDRLAPRVALLVELSQTGVRSHEHPLFPAGITNGGRVAGHPLGPSSSAVFAGARVELGRDAFLWPWLEIARQSSDLFAYGTGEIERTQDLPDELRARAGARASFPVTEAVRLELRGLAERVSTADFVEDRTRWNAAAEATATWTPGWRLTR